MMKPGLLKETIIQVRHRRACREAPGAQKTNFVVCAPRKSGLGAQEAIFVALCPVKKWIGGTGN